MQVKKTSIVAFYQGHSSYLEYERLVLISLLEHEVFFVNI